MAFGEYASISPDGSNMRQLIEDLTTISEDVNWTESAAELSFDESQLVISGFTNGNNPVAYLMNPDGSNSRLLADCLQASWSPSGNQIVCTSYDEGDGSNRIFIVDASTGDMNVLNLPPETTKPVYYITPRFSSNGSQILYVKRLNREAAGFWSANLDGSNAQSLLPPEACCFWRLSPDGTQILFASGADLILTEANAWNPKTIWTAPDYCITSDTIKGMIYGVDWSPDGKQIVAAVAPGPRIGDGVGCIGGGFPSNGGIYVLNSDGSNARNITNPDNNYATLDLYPTWRE